MLLLHTSILPAYMSILNEELYDNQNRRSSLAVSQRFFNGNLEVAGLRHFLVESADMQHRK